MTKLHDIPIESCHGIPIDVLQTNMTPGHGFLFPPDARDDSTDHVRR